MYFYLLRIYLFFLDYRTILNNEVRFIMDSHSKTYEQFCFVKQKNIIMEETVFHNGKRKIICTNLNECNNCGGCRNSVLCSLWKNDKIVQDKCKNGECG